MTGFQEDINFRAIPVVVFYYRGAASPRMKEMRNGQTICHDRIAYYYIYLLTHQHTVTPLLLCDAFKSHICVNPKTLNVMNTLNLLKENFVEIFLDKSNNIIVAKWIGFLKPDEVKKGCSFMTRYIENHSLTGHLSDHRNLKVLSKEVQDYLTQQWFPEVEKIGLRKVGAVVAEDVFAATTVSKVNREAHVGNLKINMFSSEPECVKWLLN